MKRKPVIESINEIFSSNEKMGRKKITEQGNKLFEIHNMFSELNTKND